MLPKNLNFFSTIHRIVKYRTKKIRVYRTLIFPLFECFLAYLSLIFFNGVADGDRTRDTRSHSPLLYQLSYSHHMVSRTILFSFLIARKSSYSSLFLWSYIWLLRKNLSYIVIFCRKLSPKNRVNIYNQ